MKNLNPTGEQFASALLKRDYEQLKMTLSESGKFMAQDGDLNEVELGKNDYVYWLKKRLENEIRDVRIDQCVSCLVGTSVYLFNDGHWPRIPENPGEREKAALALEFKENKISDISFCYVMLKEPNPYVVEKLGTHKLWLESLGLSDSLATAMVFGDMNGEPKPNQANRWPEDLIIHRSHTGKRRKELIEDLNYMYNENIQLLNLRRLENSEKRIFVELIEGILSST